MSNEVAISMQECARRLNIGLKTCYREAKRGRIPTLKFGRKIVVPVAALEAMGRPKESNGNKSAQANSNG
ncbi:MAG: helix-turn-helix domain-containing protein [Chloroflexi bacterium]|nr:helix-turn-helix domain-containing protein [Chloroflexota bacterium]